MLEKCKSALILQFFVCFLTVFAGCARKVNKDQGALGASSDAVSGTLESAITSMTGAVDESTGESFAKFQEKPNAWAWLNASWLSSAQASTACVRASSQLCIGGTFVQDAIFSGCSVGKTDFTVTGNTRLTWSRVGCFLQNTNDHVTRTLDLTRTGPLDGQLAVSSATHTTYDDTSVGGGQILTLNATDYSLKISGIHKVFTTAKGTTLYDHSIQTSSDIHFASLPRYEVKNGIITERKITSGAVDIYHNLLKYKVSYAVSSRLGFSKDCCYPTSGQMTGTLTGSLKGTATADFNSTCGSATVTHAGVSTPVTLALCE